MTLLREYWETIVIRGNKDDTVDYCKIDDQKSLKCGINHSTKFLKFHVLEGIRRTRLEIQTHDSINNVPNLDLAKPQLHQYMVAN
jgi:hypothetical protein